MNKTLVEEPDTASKKGCSCGTMIIAAVLLFLAIGFAIPQFGGVKDRARQMQACNNARQIIIALMAYAEDHAGRYPDGLTANEALHELIKEDYLEDERIFSAPNSPFVPDNNLGEAPDFEEALRLGENHWAMTRKVETKSDGNTPLIFENPAQATWPPTWDATLINAQKSGRIWKDHTIVVGRNDASVRNEPLANDGKPLVSLKPIKDGKNLFELSGPHEVMNVEK